MATSVQWTDLQADRALLGRIDTVERVAQVMRTRIIQGDIPPGSRLSEDSIGRALEVSRNTLREAFRLLGHERLVVHQFNRGVFVRELTIEDLHDLYNLRRMVECNAVRGLPTAPPGALERVGAAVESAQAAANAGDWRAVGTADLQFHQAIAGLAGSPRIDELMQRVLAEFCLAFAAIAESRELHEPYLERNANIYRMLLAGEAARAELELDLYLAEAEAQFAAAFARTSD